MRRTIFAAVAACLLVAAVAAPVSAGKKKKHLHESFPVTAVPFPHPDGCNTGQEDVHWVGQELKAPFSGVLRFYIEGITGDWDIFVFDGDVLLGSSTESQLQGASGGEEVIVPLEKKQKVLMVVCNFAAEPETTGHYELTG